MKTATGHYINVYSEIGYENYGIKANIDIIILFPEHMLEKDINVDDIDTVVQNKIKEYAETKYECDVVAKAGMDVVIEKKKQSGEALFDWEEIALHISTCDVIKDHLTSLIEAEFLDYDVQVFVTVRDC